MSTDYDTVLDLAVAAFDAHDYLAARGLFERAYELRPNARVLRGLGISALHLERFTLSKRELNLALGETKQPLTLTQREGVKELLSWMQLNLGTLRLKIEPADAQVMLDQELVAERELVIKPGTHHLLVSADGFAAQERSVEIDAGDDQTLPLTLTKDRSEGAEVSRAAGASPSPFMVGASLSSPRSNAPPNPTPQAQDSGSVFERWWFWTAVAAVIAGGLVTTVALTSADSKQEYEKGGLGGVIRPLELMK